MAATPLGNPGDLSLRAREVLNRVHAVLAEDTRRTGLLFARCGIEAPPLISFHEHNEEQRLAAVLGRLRAGEELALVSDAGTPLFSDPGYRLVRACREAGIRVSPLPGPCAPVAALSASGLPPHPFAFLGFAPRRAAERAAFFAPYARLSLTLAFFERKDRVAAALDSAFAQLGPREVCIARELTKTHEEFLYLTLGEHGELPELLGEVTILIGPPGQRDRSSGCDADQALAAEERQGGRPGDIAARAKNRLTGWSAKELYARLLARRCQAEPGEEAK